MRTRIKPNLYLSRKLVEGMNKSERGNHLLSYLNSDMYKLQVITNVRRNQIDMFVLYSIFYLTLISFLESSLKSHVTSKREYHKDKMAGLSR